MIFLILCLISTCLECCVRVLHFTFTYMRITYNVCVGCMNVGLLGINKQPEKQNETQSTPANKNLLKRHTILCVQTVHTEHCLQLCRWHVQCSHMNTGTILRWNCSNWAQQFPSNMQIHFLHNITKPMMLTAYSISQKCFDSFIIHLCALVHGSSNIAHCRAGQREREIER